MNRLILFMAVLMACAVAASAAPACIEGGLDTYVSLQEGCQIGDKIFSNWLYVGNAQGGALAVPADGITVTPIGTALNPGFLFSAGWLALAGQSVDSHITYTVTVPLSGPPLHDLSLEITGYGYTGGGSVSVAESTNPVLSGTPLLVYYNASGLESYDEAVFEPTTGSWVLTKNILVSGGAEGAGGFATLSGVVNQFSEIPEPMTLSLIGAGLVGLGLLRRRLKK